MHNIYGSSSIISIRNNYKTSLYPSLNEYPFCFNNLRRPSSCCCNCNCCCSFPVNTNVSCRSVLPISPSLLFGLRQSTLIQLAPSRRFILARSGNRYRLPICDVGQGDYGKSFCSDEDECTRRTRCSNGKGQGMYSYRVFEARCKFRSEVDSVGNDAEAIISLLTEEMSEECLDLSKRKGRVSKKEKTGRADFVSEKGKVRKVTVGSRQKEINVSPKQKVRDMKNRLKPVAIKLKKEGCDTVWKEEKDLLEGDDSKWRRGGSTSSYYSLSDSVDISSSTKVEAKHEGLDGESTTSDKKNSKTRGGIVIAWEPNEHSIMSGRRIIAGETKEDSKRYKDERQRHYNSSRHNEVKLGSVAECDWRKKSDKKKYTVEPSEEVKPRQDANRTQSQLSRIHESGAVKASKSQKQFTHREEDSISHKTSHEESRARQSQTDNLVRGHSESLLSLKQQREDIDSGSRADFSSSSRRVLGGSEEHAIVDESCETCGRVAREETSRVNLDHAAHSQIEGSNSAYNSSIERQVRNRIGNHLENSTMIQGSVEGEQQQQNQANHGAAGQLNSRRKYRSYSEWAEARARYAANTSHSQQHSETQTIRFEENLNSNISSQQLKIKADDKVSGRSESRKASEDVRDTSLLQSGAMEAVDNPQKLAKIRTSFSETNLKSKKKTVAESELMNRKIVQSRIRNEVQRPSKRPSFHEMTSGGTQTFVGSTSQIRAQQVAATEDERKSQPVMVPPPSQLVERDPPYFKPSSSFEKQEIIRGSKGKSFGLHEYPPAVTVRSSDEDNDSGRSQNYGTPSGFVSYADALGSAERMEKSSIQIVGDFIEKVRHDEQKGREQIQIELTADSHESHLKSRGSSGDSGAKGPSVEMWDTRDLSPSEPPEMDEPEATSTISSDIVRRSGRSLWNLIGDVVRLRWSPRDETPKSTVKSGEWCSPIESPSSGARLSPHDPDETNGNSIKGKKSRIQQVPSSGEETLLRTHSRSPKVEKGVTSTADILKHVGADASSATAITGSSTVSAGISGKEDLDWNADQQSSQATTSVDLSLPAARQFRRSRRRSQAIEEISADESELSGSGAMDQMEHRIYSSRTGASSTDIDETSFQTTIPVDLSSMASALMRKSHAREESLEGGVRKASETGTHAQSEPGLDLRLTGVSESDGKGSELKSRKLQRHNQVMKEKFDEWEEAYIHESEQWRIDEMFMREALVEAKKAADTWEVPVGAVLVQNGKIIARGYNLVEELRDSTAHAEMICIRQASNILQTWRLSETTLYVTLEPCAMCAGAILQARISTLVWGAPNKLLGADGSWIRLFPNVSEGEISSSQISDDKPPAPVHPFHPKMIIRRGILKAECAEAMQQFFQLRRKNEKKPVEQASRLSKVVHHPSKMLQKMHRIFHFMFCL